MSGSAPRRFGSIDRFEGDCAVLLVDGREQRLPRAALPQSAREGDVVDLDTRRVDPAQTEELRAEVSRARAGLRRAKKPDAL